MERLLVKKLAMFDAPRKGTKGRHIGIQHRLGFFYRTGATTSVLDGWHWRRPNSNVIPEPLGVALSRENQRNLDHSNIP